MEKRKYNQPQVETVQLLPSAVVLAGSPDGLGIGDPINGGEGG